jgi:hypothetical protein
LKRNLEQVVEVVDHRELKVITQVLQQCVRVDGPNPRDWNRLPIDWRPG